MPLSAIIFLEQSGTDTIEPLGEGHAAVLITKSASQIYEKFWRKSDQTDQRKFREELFNNACKMAKQIPAYRLGVSLNGRFWEKMEEVKYDGAFNPRGISTGFHPSTICRTYGAGRAGGVKVIS